MDSNSNRIDNINFLLNNLINDSSYSINNDLNYQIKYMNSETYNADMNAIYNRLNRLYEKTRYLYDLYDNIDYYMKDYMYSIEEEISETLKKIESQRDSLKSKTDTIYSVSFQNEFNSNFVDRDNTIISNRAFYVNGIITLPINSSEQIILSKDNLLINKYNSIKNYSYKDYNTLLDGGMYRAVYCSSSPIDVREKVTITFPNFVELNLINLKLSNCTYDNLQILLENDTRISVPDITYVYDTASLVTGIEFDIICNSPQLNTYTVEASTDTESFLNSKKESIYNTAINKLNITSDELNDYVSSIESYDELLKKYNDVLSGFYNDNQSILHNSTDKLDTSDVFKFGNPYPKIVTATIYGTKTI